MTTKKTKNIGLVIGIIILCITPFFLLGKSDALIFLKWQAYMMIFLFISIPLAKLLFQDCLCLLPFSKILGFLIPGFLGWGAGIVFHVSFNQSSCWIAVFIYFVFNACLSKVQNMKFQEWMNNIRICVKYEILFYIVFLFWIYLIGFNPAAYGTEKFMDYAFLQKMITTTKLPPDDVWFAGKSINYYYGGQYYAAFISKLMGGAAGKAEYSYNMMRALIPAIMFVGVFGITEQMLKDKVKKNNRRIQAFATISAIAAVFAGNGHYIIYGILKPIFDINGDQYWFPDATRYIGYNPLVEDDQTIHEFPCYSFVLGDLHAHMVNIMVVVLIIALLYSFVKSKRTSFRCPQIYLIGLAWGICNFTNYWDYIIYFVVIAITVIFTNIVKNEAWKSVLAETFTQLIIIGVIGIVTALPFTLHFDSVFNGVGIAQKHSKLYQMIVLWGIPFVTAITFICIVISSFLKKSKKSGCKKAFKSILPSDMFVFILSCCAIGLVIIPELVYVRDIYEATHARANTMFKLTYQAFIMFSICSGYILYLLTEQKTKIFGYVLLGLYVLTIFYFFNAADSWFGNWLNPTNRIGTYALNYLDIDEFSGEKDAILWLKEKVEKENETKTVAEAPGLSYTNYERVSTITGLSTPAGWQVHEWLWRDSYDSIHDREEDIDALYTKDKSTAEKMIKKYNIKYIFFGMCEEEKYGSAVKESVKELGKVIYEDNGAFIVEVD